MSHVLKRLPDESGLGSEHERMPSIRDQLKDRHLAQWGVAYVAGAFVALQVMDALAEPMNLSPFFQRAIIVLLLTGLPATLVLAWYHGEKGVQRVTLGELLILGMLGVVGVGALWMVRDDTSRVVASRESGVTAVPEPGDDEGIGVIAVLPFEEFTPPREEFRLADAIHDEILTQLYQVRGLNPISRTSVLALRDAQLTTRQIADTLKARYVVEGSIQHVEDRVKLTAQLIDPVRDLHLWAEDREFVLSDFFTLQDEAARWVVEKLLEVTAAQPPTLSANAADEEAYEAYLNGRYLAASRKEEDFARAIDEYRRAIALDSTFARALSSLALTYALWGHYGYGGAYASYETFGEALAMADRAVRLAPELADAHATRAYLLSKALAPADTVEAAFRRALDLAPGSADAHILYAGFLAREGRFAESIAESRQAILLDPIAPGRDSGLGYNALAAGQLTVALRAAERASVLEPDLMAPRIIRAFSLVLMGQPEQCLDLDLGPYDAVRAVCLHAAGRTDEAEMLIERVAGTHGPRNAMLHLASYHAWVGDAAGAIRELERAYETSPHGLDYRIVASAVFDPVREDPGFEDRLASLREGVWERVREARAG